MARIYRHDPLRVPEEAVSVATWDEDGNLLATDGSPVSAPPSLEDLEEGDLLYFDGSSLTRLPIGTNGQVLTVVSGEVAWATPT